MRAENLRKYEQPREELAHYAKRTVDLQYRFFPEREDEEKQWDELEGIANRTDFDLKSHSKKPINEEGKRLNTDSTADLTYFDHESNQHVFPYVIEPSAGVARSVLAFLMDAYTEEEVGAGKAHCLEASPRSGSDQSGRAAACKKQGRNCAASPKISSHACSAQALCAPFTTTQQA